MLPDTVFARTAEGERLARTPRQISSYSHRATLLLVDGRVTVGELRNRFGKSLAIETILEQLERDGLVEVKTAAESPAEAHLESGELAGLDFDPLFDPAVERFPVEDLVEPEAETPWDGRREPMLPGGAPASAQSEDHHPPLAADPDEAAGALAKPPTDRRPIPHKLGRGAWALGLGGLALVVVAVLAWWFAGLRPRVEAEATAALGVPVSVGSIGPAIRHGPALLLKDVRLALDSPIDLPRVEVKPDPRQGNVWSLSRVSILGASLKPSEISALAGLFGRSAAPVELGFDDLGLRLGELHVGGLAGSLARAPEGEPVLTLGSPAGGLSMEARPRGRGLAVDLHASPGILPFLGRPQIGSVELKGLLDDAGFSGGELGMTGYGGKLEGTLKMAWDGPVSVDARLRFAAVSMNHVSRSLFQHGGFAAGQASGTLSVQARAPRWEELTRIDRVSGSFTVERGVISGFDLGAALRERSPRPLSGGETRFDSLRGRLDAGPREIRVWVDRLDAGALTASGLLTVAGFDGLQGNLSAAVQVPSRGVQRYPARVAGTVAQPSIQLLLPGSGEVSAPE